MKCLKSYKIFENEKPNPTKDFFKDKINNSLIQDLKDLSLELLDEHDDLQLTYSILTNDKGFSPILMGFYRIKDEKLPDHLSDIEREFVQSRQLPKEWEHWTNFYDEYRQEAIENYEKNGLIYRIGFYSGQPREESFNVLKEEYFKHIIDRLREMYPQERIEITEY